MSATLASATVEGILKAGLKLRDPDALRCVQSDARTVWVAIPLAAIGESEAGYRQVVDADALAAKVGRLVAARLPVRKPKVRGVQGDRLLVAVLVAR